MPIVSVPVTGSANLPKILIEVDTSPPVQTRATTPEKVLASARDLFADGLELARGCSGETVA